MSMDLDKRQRAMLREMGVRVWQPMGATPRAAGPVVGPPQPAQITVAPIAIDLVAAPAREQGAASTFTSKNPAPVRVAEPAAAAARPATAEALWSVGEALALYADTATGAGPRWLVLAETPAGSVQGGRFNPFAGDAGKLLDNMLRATRLHQAGAAWLAPLVRRSGADAASANLQQALPGMIASLKPDIVLVMGRLAAMALLQSNEPFGKLRGQVHDLHGIQTIVTQDAGFLLRQPADKAKAWEDLCLAMSLAATAGH
jgi:DNA polymerase